MNLLTYAQVAQQSFDELPFNELDAAVFSQLCMLEAEHVIKGLATDKPIGSSPATSEPLDFRPRTETHSPTTSQTVTWNRGVALHELWKTEYFDELIASLIPMNIYQLLGVCAASPRYRNLRFARVEALSSQEEHVQFGAVTFLYDGAQPVAVVAFRGTNTELVGWRENFDMALCPPVPGQTRAANYLKHTAEHMPENSQLFVVGHSKGGNLATYATLENLNLLPKISAVYDFDGPGFKAGFIPDDCWTAVGPTVHRIVPQASVVGMLMDNPLNCEVVQAHDADTSQHSPFTWDLDLFDSADKPEESERYLPHLDSIPTNFARAEELSGQSKLAREVFASWLKAQGEDNLPEVFDAFFEVLDAAGMKDASAVFSRVSAGGAIKKLQHAAKSAAPETRDILLGALSKLAHQFVAEGVSLALNNTEEEQEDLIGNT